MAEETVEIDLDEGLDSVSELGLLENASSKLQNVWRMLEAIKKLDRDSPDFPESLRLLEETMQDAAGEARELMSRDPEFSPEDADRFRHVEGMRAAANDPRVGAMTAWVGGLGYELKNLKDRLYFPGGDLNHLGKDAWTLGQSMTDLWNNTMGVLDMTNRGSLPSPPRTGEGPLHDAGSPYVEAMPVSNVIEVDEVERVANQPLGLGQGGWERREPVDSNYISRQPAPGNRYTEQG